MTIEFREMEFFVEVVRAGSITLAAQQMHILKSTGSQWLKALEERLGVQLFTRTTRGMQPTAVGQAYFERCLQILEAKMLAEEMIFDTRRTPKGRLRIALPANLGVIYFTHWIAEFMCLYPDIEVELDAGLGVRMIDMPGKNFDVWIKLGPVPDSSLVVRKLGTLTSSLYASPAYLASLPAPQAPDDLRLHNCLHPDEQFYTFERWVFTRDGQSITPEIKGNITVSNMAMLRKFVEFGMGIALLPDLYVQAEVADGRMVRLLPDWAVGALDIYLLMQRRELLPARIRYFADFVADKFAALSIAQAAARQPAPTAPVGEPWLRT